MKPPFHPHITEKSYRFISEEKKAASTYTFKTALNLTREALKNLVEKKYKVNVISIHTINLPGKTRRFKGVKGQTSRVRKILLRLKPGQRISDFDVESKQEENSEKETITAKN